jgi:hypothetical protein
MTAAAVPNATQPYRGDAGFLRPADVVDRSEVTDRSQVTDLIHLLAIALDEHRYDDVGRLFAVDGSVWTPGGTAQGRAAVAEQARRSHSGYARTQHRMANVLVDLAGDEATLRADAVARFIGPDTDRPAPIRTVGAVYRCRALRTDEGWRFMTVEIERVWEVDGP